MMAPVRSTACDRNDHHAASTAERALAANAAVSAPGRAWIVETLHITSTLTPPQR